MRKESGIDQIAWERIIALVFGVFLVVLAVEWWQGQLLIGVALILVLLSGGLGGITFFMLRSWRREVNIRRMQQEKMTEQLLEQGKLAVLGRLSAGIVHELNNPLMLIREHAGWIKDLMEDESADSMQHYDAVLRSASKIESQVDRAAQIAKRTLGFVREEKHDTALNIRSFVADIFGLLHRQAADKKVTLSCFEESMEVVLKDPEGLQQVIFNLIGNAIDAVPQGGHVRVDCSVEENNLCLRVSDSGPGIPNELVKKLFQPFITTKAQGKGTGLGLYLSQQLVASMGGTLSAANLPTGGAVFTVQLPREKY